MACLLEIDSSAEVVAGGILGCVNSSDHSNILEKIDVLLKANPEATKHRFSPLGVGHYTEQNVLHVLANNSKRADMPSSLCISIMQRIHAIHPDAVKEVCRQDHYNHQSTYLPVHIAAIYGDVEVMDFLLGLYPDSATVVVDASNASSQNLLHIAAIGPSDESYDAAKQDPKIRYLCTRYPAMMHQRDGEGRTPLHRVVSLLDMFHSSGKIPKATIMLEIGGQELTREPTIHPTDTDNSKNGWLPLHYLSTAILYHSLPLLSEEADLFRMMLRWYPEAAGIEGGSGAYQLAVSRGAHPYYLRLLLRAAPDVNPVHLRELNYAERRMAMFLAFTARAKEVTPLLLARLRFENKDLLKRVVSFL